MDAIVVDQEKTGKDCIQYIKEQVRPHCSVMYTATADCLICEQLSDVTLSHLGSKTCPLSLDSNVVLIRLGSSQTQCTLNSNSTIN